MLLILAVLESFDHRCFYCIEYIRYYYHPNICTKIHPDFKKQGVWGSKLTRSLLYDFHFLWFCSMSTSMDYPGGHGTRQSTPESFEMSDKRRWPSTTSMTPSGSRSFYSYTPSHSSYNLPIVMERTNPDKKMPDNWGLACCSMFINPIFGLVAILLAGKVSAWLIRCWYWVQAMDYVTRQIRDCIPSPSRFHIFVLISLRGQPNALQKLSVSFELWKLQIWPILSQSDSNLVSCRS